MTTDMITVYISIGNSDDKLTQYAWSAYVGDVRQVLRNVAFRQHGEWFSAGDSPWQNACWCVEILPVEVDEMRAGLAAIAGSYRQDSIAWAVAETEFIGAAS